MGLDITFLRKDKRNKHYKEIGYFRKANFLVPFFFEDYLGGYESEEIHNAYNKLKDLHKRCEIVLRDRNETISDDILPTYSIPFGGNTSYNGAYYLKVKEVKEWLDLILKHWDDCKFMIEVIC